MVEKQVIVIGAGLAGSEAAWQLANLDVPVKLVLKKCWRKFLKNFVEILIIKRT